jgi:Zn-dependent peptidase ImmA (M78 family)
VADKAQGVPMIRSLGKIEQKVRRTAIGGYNRIDASIVVCSLQPATKRRFCAIHDELHFLLHPQCGRS